MLERLLADELTSAKLSHWAHAHDVQSVRVQRSAALSATESLVYFVERDGFVKIGTTTNLARRLRDLARGGAIMPQGMTIGPMTVLATMPGTRRNEAFLHQRFAHLRLEGEWFLLEDEIRDFIAGLSCNRTSAA